MEKRDQFFLPIDGDVGKKYRRICALQMPETAELLGLCEGVIADKRVVYSEVRAIMRWLEKNEDIRDQWPCDVIFRQISSVLSDDCLDVYEQEEMFTLLSEICSGDMNRIVKLTNSIPYNECRDIEIMGNTFCFTGECLLGPRRCCEKMIRDRGGEVKEYVVRDSVLVVGGLASNKWSHGYYGDKIEKALQYRQGGHGVKIIPENILFYVL